MRDNSVAASPELRRALLEVYLRSSSSSALSEWLRDIGQDATGTAEEKKQRIRENTKYLSMPAEDFPRQTVSYLRSFSTDVLAEICEELGLSSDGTKDALFRRIYREVGFREQWLSRISAQNETLDKNVVLPFVEWYPIIKRGTYERDFYQAFDEEMLELFGEENVHLEHPIAHGSTLKIDFHIGHPQKGGVGVEFKMPASNSDIQRALGQMDQYMAAYGHNLIVVLLPDLLQSAQETLFIEALRGKKIETVVKKQA